MFLYIFLFIYSYHMIFNQYIYIYKSMFICYIAAKKGIICLMIPLVL